MADTRYIATENIYAAAGVLAYNKGSIVPPSAVENLNAQDKVASDRTKAAKVAVEETSTSKP